jgi:hypothetical protein
VVHHLQKEIQVLVVREMVTTQVERIMKVEMVQAEYSVVLQLFSSHTSALMK